jgi:type III secretory pathway component EscS
MYLLLTESLYATLVLSLVPMAAVACGAGAVTLLQAITQVQEQSLVHFVRLVVMAAIIIASGGHAMASLEAIFLKALSLVLSSGGA